MRDILIREAKPGEASLVSYFYFKLFESEFDFNACTEQYFLHAVSEIFDDPQGNRLWVAVEGEKIVGSICIVKRGEGEAQLRMFGTAPDIQGSGTGTRLLETAMQFCKDSGYKHIILWTIDICKAAIHLYDRFGFVRTDTKPNTTWANYFMTEELWEYSEQ